jgi:hypothetical protein
VGVGDFIFGVRDVPGLMVFGLQTIPVQTVPRSVGEQLGVQEAYRGVGWQEESGSAAYRCEQGRSTRF